MDRTIFPIVELQEEIESLIETICGYEGMDIQPPDNLIEAQRMAALAIQKLQSSTLISEAMTEVKLHSYTQKELDEALEDMGLSFNL